MSADDDILQQQTLLKLYRQTLAHYLYQRASLGSAHIPPGIANGIVEARAEIRRIKESLRRLGIAVQDSPNDGEESEKPDRPLPLHNLPQRTYVEFVGRQSELEQLKRLMLPHPRSRHFVVTIDGIGGVGKSTLALELAHYYRENYATLQEHERFGAIIWVSAKRNVLTASGIQQRRQSFEDLDDLFREIAVVLEQPEILQSAPEQRRGLVEHALTDYRTLVIIDNLETIDDEELLSFLRELPEPTKAIVTTRHRIDIAYAMRLTGMHRDDAVRLMQVESESKNVILTAREMRDLERRTGGVPLAIIWSIGLMSLGYNTHTILRRLSQGQSDIARFCFEESVTYIRGNDAYRLLLTLGRFFELDASRQELGIMAGLSEDEVGRDDGLAELLRLSLVNKDNDRFSLLPLTRSFVQAELLSQNSVVSESPDNTLNEALSKYIEIELRNFDLVDLSGLPDLSITTRIIALRQIYIPLWLVTSIDRVTKAREIDSQVETDIVSIGSLLRENRHLGVLGDPGGGKTTLLRWLATAYLLNYQGEGFDETFPDVQSLPYRRWMPLLIRCRELDGVTLTRDLTNVLIQKFIKIEFPTKEISVLVPFFLAQIKEGNILLLIDGIDEIGDAQSRSLFCRQIQRIAVDCPQTHIIVTSRITGYTAIAQDLGVQFKHATIADLSDEQKTLFLRRWTDLAMQHRPSLERDQIVRDLIEAVSSSLKIARLTNSPLMLTTLALVQRKIGVLPARRSNLLYEAVTVLLNWNSSVYESIDLSEAIPQLGYLAFDMLRHHSLWLSESQVLESIEKMRAEYPNVRSIKTHSVREFIELVETRSNILVRSSDGYWEFSHLIFQEYLAARALVDGRFPGRIRSNTLAQNAASIVDEFYNVSPDTGNLNFTSSWEEVMRLVVVSCSDDDVDDILLAIVNPSVNEDERVIRLRIELAFSCLSDEPNVNSTVRQEIMDRYSSTNN